MKLFKHLIIILFISYGSFAFGQNSGQEKARENEKSPQPHLKGNNNTENENNKITQKPKPAFKAKVKKEGDLNKEGENGPKPKKEFFAPPHINKKEKLKE